MKIRFITLIATMICSSNVWGNFTIDQLTYGVSSEENREVYIADCKDTVTSVTIPNTVSMYGKEYSVVGIGENAFANCTSLASINIPNSITTISDYAFYNCSALTELTVPGSVTGIGKEALYGCKSLTTLHIMEGLDSIGQYAFWQCYALKDIYVSPDNPKFCSEDGILYNKDKTALLKHAPARPNTTFTVPASVTRIHECAFEDCKSLTSVILPQNLTYIGCRAFSYCQALAEINIPVNLQEIDDEAFGNCRSLTSLILPESLNKIGNRAFTNCSNLHSVQLPANLTRIENSTFSNCVSLTGINFPETISFIGGNAFASCSLTQVTLPSQIETIEEYCFYNCKNLTSVSLPADHEINIGKSAFEGTHIITFYCKGTTPPVAADAFSWTNLQYSALFIPSQSVEAYKATEPWSKFGYVEDIESHATFFDVDTIRYRGENGTATAIFNADSWATEVVVPESVTQNGNLYTVTGIGNNAFESNSMSAIRLPQTITRIGNKAFFYCNSLQSIELPEQLSEIGEEAFYNCQSLQTVTIPESVSEIKYQTFAGCNKLEKVHVPEGLKRIHSYAFAYCSSLTAFDVPAQTDSIGNGVFNACSALNAISVSPQNTKYTSIDGVLYNKTGTQLITYPAGQTALSFTLSDKVIRICQDAFFGNTCLQYVYIPNSVQEIGSRAFNSCVSLDSVRLPESLTEIPDYTFYKCQSLRSIQIPAAVKRIGTAAFYNCQNLASIRCEAINPPVIDLLTFNFVPTDIPIYVPQESINRYKEAEYWSTFSNYQGIQTGICNMNFSKDITFNQGLLHNPNSLSIQIFDTSGRLIYQGSETTIHLSEKGIYLIHYQQKTIKVSF